ncbi:glycosyltransferase family 4 protein [Actinoplanes teichomyceticus]|uniref:Glycosyltransferase involved in cell wall biosynthesis n=1 Tax=Actinoplanes teichomyceticus TaxID=1867 RepID=A0A561VGB5_ACTTI|nr:glycosyltransferase family 4 protein [Actinoplanes teichomyceticus]TWG10624.1 glycosyltransferase involved in cell wall biosynthesis [Actinoplanes teichomyceticus]GIF15393.1 N-acetylglucosaminyl-phosphatidylinositol biosynthetic protein Spt14 [Actinoplanes teichomyceticus]
MSTTTPDETRLRSPRTGGPLRVLEVSTRYLPDMGGIETHVDEVSRRLAARGDIHLTVLTSDRTRSYPHRERRDGFEVRRVPAWPSTRDYYLAPGILRGVLAERWDLVHVQGIHTPVPLLAMLAARRARTPYVVTLHTGGHSSTARHAMRSLQWQLAGPLLRQARHVVAVSRAEGRLFQRLAGVPAGRMSVIRNGGGLPPARSTVDPVPGRLVSIGRLERYKGHHRVIEALPYILRQVPHAHLDILGAGPYEAQLRRIADGLGVAAAVTIRAIPPNDRDGMAAALGAAQVIAAFSDYEAHPVAVMEALTTGRPVVGYDVAGMADLVEDGLVTGLRPGTPPEVAARALLDAMGGPGRPLDSLPTWDGCADALAEVYRAAVGPRAASVR